MTLPILTQVFSITFVWSKRLFFLFQRILVTLCLTFCGIITPYAYMNNGAYFFIYLFLFKLFQYYISKGSVEKVITVSTTVMMQTEVE